MKAIYIVEFSKDLQLELRDIEPPVLRESTHVLVRVAAAGLNRADLLQAAGQYPPPSGYDPRIPGLEFAGEVAEIGDEVTNWNIGDRVFGIAAGEAQAEFLVADEKHLALIPNNLSFTEAAAIPEAFITAYDAIFSQGKLESDRTLLIHAVGSGVGLAGLQIAKAKGATVIGTSRTPEKLDRCREFGLDHATVTDGSDFSNGVLSVTNGRGADVILDLVGGAYFEQNLLSIANRGVLMVVGLTAGRTAELNMGLLLQKRATIIGTTMRARPIDEKTAVAKILADEIAPLLAAGKLTPNIDRVFAASDAVEAYKYLASNKSFGKLILEF